jgi:hypothetical protein
VKALKQTKRQYQVLYCGIRGQGVLNIYLFGFVLIPIPVQCVAVLLFIGIMWTMQPTKHLRDKTQLVMLSDSIITIN